MGRFHQLTHRHANSIWLAFLCGIFGATPAYSQQPAAPAQPLVKSIRVEYMGPASVSKERILAQMRTKVGEPYSQQVVEQDIKNLYKTGAILNVRIFGEPTGDGLAVTVAVQTRSVIREIVVDGAHRIKPRKIRKTLDIKLGAPANEEDLEKARQKVVDSYRVHGFNEATVQFRVEPIDEKKGTARVVYLINEGEKGAIRRIEFQGNEHFSDVTLRRQMKTHGKTLISFFDKSGRLDEVQLQQDLDKVREFYQNKGYIDVEVKDVRKERQKGGPMIIVVSINEGIQYHVGKITVSGEKIATEAKVRSALKTKEGDPYSPKTLHDDAKTLADGYGAGGYVDSDINPESIPAGNGRIDIHIKIEEGDRSFVQRINITGNTRTKDKVIRREVLVAPGDTFDTMRVDRSKKRLENLGYFSKVETFPEDTGIPGRKDLDVIVEEKRTGSLTFGGGFSSIDGLVGFAELSQGNFDITNWPTLTGGGQKFRMRLQLGTRRKDVLLALTEPYFLDRRLSLGGQVFYSEADYLSSLYQERDFGFAIEARKPLGPFFYATLGYRLEDIDIFDVATGSSPQILAEKGSTVKSTVNTSLVFDRRDNPLLSRTGQRISVAPYVSGGPLGGDEQIYGFDVEASQYFHFPGDLILLLNAEVATVDVWDSPETKTVLVGGTVNPSPPPRFVRGSKIFATVPNVPIFDRLFLGGANNLRGFNYRDVSPKDQFGEPLGGQSMARYTSELTFPLVLKTRAAIFYDTGFVNPDPWDFSRQTFRVDRTSKGHENRKPLVFRNVASDFGFGLRLDLPIGPLRLDYGIPIQAAGNSTQGQFNFSVGYQF